MKKTIYSQLFKNAVGKPVGSWAEKKFIPDLFQDVSVTSGHCDGHFSKGKKNKRQETKCFRAVYSHEPAESTVFQADSFESRALFSHEDHGKGVDRHGNVHDMKTQAKFQQVKPEEFDWLIGVAIFLDKIRVYLVPSGDICTQTSLRNKKIKLSPQHRNEQEGQIMAKDLVNYLILEVTTPLDKKTGGLAKIKSRKLADYINK